MDNQEEMTEELDELFASLDLQAYLDSLPPDPLDTLASDLRLREVTTEELAEVLGVTTARITQLWQNGDIPEPCKYGKRNYFPLLHSVRGYIEFLRIR